MDTPSEPAFLKKIGEQEARFIQVLIVDDDDVDRERLKRLLARSGKQCAFSEAKTIRAAATLLETQKFDCVLLDYHLSGEIGLELLPLIRRHRSETCPVVLVTQRDTENLLVQAMRHGVSDFISKSSLNAERLSSVLAHCLSQAATQDAERQAARNLEQLSESMRREHDQSLLLAAEQADAANRAKTMFLANMSHEIRTPLNAIIGLAYLLSRTARDHEQTDLSEKIQIASKSLLAIVNNVLDLSKIGAASLKIRQSPFAPAAVIHDLAKLVEVQLREPAITFRVDLPRCLPNELVGDVTRLHQVLLNLLTNAIKFTDAGHVELRLTDLGSKNGARRLCFTVTDTGIGIASDVLATLFVPFKQADDSTTRRYAGTGLGLSISQEIVRLMGGEIRVESRPGRGSKFWFELTFPEVTQADIGTSVKPVGTNPAKGLETLCILIVDDSPLNLEVASSILTYHGAVVHTAANGQIAVDLVLAEPRRFDVVLMDLQMPILDGQDAFRRIRSVLGTNRPVIIALTAGTISDDNGHGSDDRMDGLVHKPFEIHALIDTIISRLGRALTEAPQPVATVQQVDGWPVIPGIDLDDVRRRLADDKSLFLLALTTLAREFNGFEDALAAAVDDAESARFMHRLKGSAGVIGAKSLEKLAANAESAYRSGSGGATDWRNQVIAAITTLRADIATAIA